MSIIKSFSVGDGDMFYIKHGSSNFTIIDCNLDYENEDRIIEEIITERKGKNITRVISTHPDEDHLHGIKRLDQAIGIVNFYCVMNCAEKDDETEDFKHYCRLRDGKSHYYVYKGCKRKWMNDNDKGDGKNYGSSGINFLWPDTKNSDFIDALIIAEGGKEFNNISPIFTYCLNNGVKAMWMGDMEHYFLEKIKDCIDWPEIDILFAPHHGRDSGKVSGDVLEKLKPHIIVIGEAPSKYINYYTGYNTIKQNSAGDIVFECADGMVHVYISKDDYSYDISFLSDDEREDNAFGYYLGSFRTKGA